MFERDSSVSGIVVQTKYKRASDTDTTPLNNICASKVGKTKTLLEYKHRDAVNKSCLRS